MRIWGIERRTGFGSGNLGYVGIWDLSMGWIEWELGDVGI